jgi:CheY-like chemotaxis protein
MSSTTVLHVDDDPDVLAVSERVIGSLDGVTAVETTVDADDALDRIDRGDVDYLVSDSLRTAAGESFVAVARQAAPDLPIIVFSAKQWSVIAADADAASANAVARKATGNFDALRSLLLDDAVAANSGDGAIVTSHDWADTTEFVSSLANAVATLEGRPVDDLRPLYDRFDPEALEDLLTAAATTLEVRIPIHDVALVLAGDGTIRVSSA